MRPNKTGSDAAPCTSAGMDHLQIACLLLSILLGEATLGLADFDIQPVDTVLVMDGVPVYLRLTNSTSLENVFGCVLAGSRRVDEVFASSQLKGLHMDVGQVEENANDIIRRLSANAARTGRTLWKSPDELNVFKTRLARYLAMSYHENRPAVDPELFLNFKSQRSADLLHGRRYQPGPNFQRGRARWEDLTVPEGRRYYPNPELWMMNPPQVPPYASPTDKPPAAPVSAAGPPPESSPTPQPVRVTSLGPASPPEPVAVSSKPEVATPAAVPVPESPRPSNATVREVNATAERNISTPVVVVKAETTTVGATPKARETPKPTTPFPANTTKRQQSEVVRKNSTVEAARTTTATTSPAKSKVPADPADGWRIVGEEYAAYNGTEPVAQPSIRELNATGERGRPSEENSGDSDDGDKSRKKRRKGKRKNLKKKTPKGRKKRRRPAFDGDE